MPRFYFDLYDDVHARDDEGIELPNLEAAKLHALVEARVMLQTSVAETGRIDLHHHINIRDVSDGIVHVMHFGDAVTVQRGAHVLSQPTDPA